MLCITPSVYISISESIDNWPRYLSLQLCEWFVAQTGGIIICVVIKFSWVLTKKLACHSSSSIWMHSPPKKNQIEYLLLWWTCGDFETLPSKTTTQGLTMNCRLIELHAHLS